MPPITAPVQSIRVKLPKCTLTGTDHVQIPLEEGIYEITFNNPKNPKDGDLQVPGSGHITVGVTHSADGTVTIS